MARAHERVTADPKPVREFISAVRATVEHRGLLKGGELVVLAVSGGPDSLALLHSFARLAPDYRLTLHVAHFDHRLREGSERDAAFVAREAARLGLEATVGAADSIEPIRGMSPEEAARARRLRFLGEVARSLSAARIATGHTMDDQAETVLMRVLVGAGRRGLSGIPPRRWYYIRPLIDRRRSEIETFCRSLRLRPRRDPTNSDPAYLRNRVRAEVLPFLTGTLNARLTESLARLADIVRDEDYELDRRASALAFPEASPDGGRLSIHRLRDLPVAMQRRAIRLLARSAGPGIDHLHTETVRRLALGGESGKSVDLPGGLSARVEYGFLLLGTAPSPVAPATPVRLAVPGETDLSPWGVALRCWITTERPVTWPDGKAVCVLDADRVALPLQARAPRPGDRFRPLGMRDRKKLGDFFTDAKVPRADRPRVPIVVGNGSIVWVVGHRIDAGARVTPGTRRFLWMVLEGGTT
jgi:tRNA(Ile)-lysidine synthase